MIKKYNNISNYRFVLVVLLSLALLAGCTGEKKPDDSIPQPEENPFVAMVNDEGITVEEYQAELQALKDTVMIQSGTDPDKDPELLAKLEDQALQSLINAALVVQEAQNRGIKVTQEDVDEAMGRIMSGFENEEKFKEALAKNGMDIDVLREQIKEDLIINKILTEIYEENNVTEQGQYNEILEKFINELREKSKIEIY